MIHILIGKPTCSDPLSVFVTEHGALDVINNIQAVLAKIYGAVDVLYCTLLNYKDVIDSIPAEHIIFQLCDGTEIDGYPGLSVIQYLERNHRKFTGARSDFFEATTSKRHMKHQFVRNKISTPRHTNAQYIRAIDRFIGYPMIVKPDVSYGSVGLCLLTSPDDLEFWLLENHDTKAQYIFEQYINGREFTVLITDDMTYTPAERVFVGDFQYLEFNKYWKSSELVVNGDGSYSYPEKMNNDDLVTYKLVTDDTLCLDLKTVAKKAYTVLHGNSYGRVDIRQNMEDGELHVLEVNAMPGLSFDTETSLGTILTLHGSYDGFIDSIFRSV